MIGLLLRLLMLPVRLALLVVAALTSSIEGALRSNRRRAVRSSPRRASASSASTAIRGPGASPQRPATNRHLWLTLSPAYTFGVISFVPALNAALKLKRPRLWYWCAGLVAGDVVLWILLSASGNADSPGVIGDLGTLLAISLAVVGTHQAFGLRREVFGNAEMPQDMTAAFPVDGQDPAIAQALSSRQRRRDSRALAARDPLLARDLMIGRPDLNRRYDDGGLIDINHVPEPIFLSHVGLTPEQAHVVVEARQQVGRFESLDDMWNLANLPPAEIDTLRDRLIAL